MIPEIAAIMDQDRDPELEASLPLPKLRAALAEQVRRRKLELARERMLHFVQWTKADYRVNWHHRLICETLDEFVFGDIDRLMIFTPPRNGKSELVSRRLPPFIFGQDPRAKIITASYASSLANQMSRATQRVMDSTTYHELFPSTFLSGSPWSGPEDARKHFRQIANYQTVGSEGEEGTYRAAGTGMGITGMGARWVIIDDPIKGQEEADSKLARDSLYDWYMSELYQRLEDGGKILITMTRWHEDDLCGRLLAESASDPEKDRWTVLYLPALREELPESECARLEKQGYRLGVDPRKPGDPLWPDKYPLPRLEKMRATMPPRIWNSVQEQRPSSPKGNIFERSWWKFYREAPAVLHEIILSCDLKFNSKTDSGSYVVYQVWGRTGAQKWLLDQFRQRVGYVASKSALRTLSAKWPKAYRKLIEKKANGDAILDDLGAEISGMIPIVPTESKAARAHAVSPTVEAGNVFLPDPSIAPWVHDLIEEAAAFKGIDGEVNDQVDAMTQALRDFAGREQNGYENLVKW